MISFVAAVAENRVIGKDNKLIWHIPEDLAIFKKITYGKTIIMGRKTFASMPGILEGRSHIILTRDHNFRIENQDVIILTSIKDLKTYIEDEDEFFVIGGGEIFRLLLPYAKKLYLSRLHAEFEGDTFFPHINEEEWNIIKNEEHHDEKSGIDFTFQILERKEVPVEK